MSCRFKKLLIGFVIIVILLTIKLSKIKYDEIMIIINQISSSPKFNKIRSQKIIKSETTLPWAPTFSHMYSCPICFGYNMCNEIMKGSVLFHGELTLAHYRKVLWRKGVLQTRRVLISSVVMEEWSKLDEFLCKNASQSVPCDLSSAIWKTAFAEEDLLTIQKFKNLNSLLDVPNTQLAFSVCSSNKLLNEVIKSFDENYDGLFDKEERILLLTSLMMQPGYVILKLQAKTKMTMPMPNLLGACGRSIILEGGLEPLKSFLTESFDMRAGLAVQVLQLVEDFEEEDLQWYFLHMGFTLDGLAVTQEGEVVVTDFDNIIILDKTHFPPDSKKKTAKTVGLCNEICFQEITLKMFASCSYISEYGQLMYAIVCKQVLSDIEEHKAEGFFNFDGHRIHKKQDGPGLLHSIPPQVSRFIEDLLRECVQETKPNGRKRAISDLRDILENYVNINYSNNGLHSHDSHLIALDVEPFLVVNRAGFNQLIKYLAPHYPLPGRKYFQNKVLPELHDKTKGLIQMNINEGVYLLFVTDIWTSSINNESFISLTAHFLDPEMKQKVYSLNCKHFPLSHTGNNIFYILKDILFE